MSQRIVATRLNLVRARRRMERVAKGTNLLRRKREALVGELFRIARPAVDARAEISRQAVRAFTRLLDALAVAGSVDLTSYAWPVRELTVDLEEGQVWGLSASEIVQRPAVKRTVEARGTPPGSTGLAAVEAADGMETLVDMVLGAASDEQRLRRLGEALLQTSRQVNTLEQRVTPSLQQTVTAVSSALEEREREERVRLQRLRAHHRGRAT